MPFRNHIAIYLALALTLAAEAPAQSASLVTNPSAKPYFNSVSLSDGTKKQMDFVVKTAGTVRGRVFSPSAPPANEDSQKGIPSVRVRLRSRDNPFKAWYWEQFTNEDGFYTYEGLRPGAYYLEIDPADIPERFHSKVETEQTDEPVVEPSPAGTLNGELSGVLFIDKNRNRKFDPAQDIPVQGATVSGAGTLAVSGRDGSYRLCGLGTGRVGIVVQWPRRAEMTHLVLDLGDGLTPMRNVNVEFRP